MSTAAFLKGQCPGGSVYAIGEPGLFGALYDAGFTRLVGSVEGDFIARGDAQGEEAEALLPTADIQGAVIAALPGGGEVWGFLSSLWGPPVVLVVGVLLLALPSLFGLGREPAGTPAQEQPGKYRPRH